MSRKNPYVFVDNLSSCAAEVLHDFGMPADKAQEAGRRISAAMCARYARTHVYIPVAMDLTQHLGQRNRDILEKYGKASPTARPFTTQRIAELSQEYGLAENYLYEVLREAHNMMRRDQGLVPLDERQPPLL